MKRKLSYANVMSTLAVVLALGGGTTAIAVSSKVGGQDLKPIVIRQATATDLTDPEPDVATATCQKGERRTGGIGSGLVRIEGVLSTIPGAPTKNGWTVTDHSNSGIAPIAMALCLKK